MVASIFYSLGYSHGQRDTKTKNNRHQDSDDNSANHEEIKLPWWQNKAIVAKCILGFFVLVIIIMIASRILQ